MALRSITKPRIVCKCPPPLFLDLLKDPAVAPDEDHELDAGITYGFKFASALPRSDHRQHWIKVGAILDCQTAEKLD